ncbi:MAG: glycosyltransferase family 4 protein [Rubripirellula sp.]|nr:glycosyltransferase family 4 protein [Rubripirellula sp.]
MKIACVIHSLNGGGAERVLASLASRLVSSGHAVTLVMLDDGTKANHELDARVQVRHLNLMADSHHIIQKVRNTQMRVSQMRTTLRELAPDVILSFCDRTNILTLMAARPLAIPVVVSERSDPAQQRLGFLWEQLRNRTYRQATAIVALTDTSANHLRQRLKVDVSVIPSAVDRPPFQSDRAAACDHRRILGVGRLEPEKGFDRLIEAFHSLAGSHPDWTLRILGEGSQREALQQQITAMGLTERVSLPGWVMPVWEELGAATLFALPSRYEGFPSALLEAMAMGVPCVAVDCESGPRAVIQNEHQGLLVPNEVTALSDGLRRLIDEKAEREELGRTAVDVAERFSWESMVDQYETVLRRVTATEQRDLPLQ